MIDAALRLSIAVGFACWFAQAAFGATYGKVKVKCPIDGTVFTAVQAFSGTRFGIQLDLKPTGPMPAPWPLARCPSNGFVIYKDQFTKAELAKLRTFVASREFREIRKEKSNYFVAAKLQRFMGEAPAVVAWTLLQATWEAGDRYPRIAAEALAAHTGLLSERTLDAETRVTAQLVAGELERRLQKFDAAKSRFSAIQGDPEFQDGYLAAVIALQLRLVDARDSGAHEVPREFESLRGPSREEREALEAARRLDGSRELQELFDLKRAIFGSVNSMPESLHVDLVAKKPALLDAVWWWNPWVDGKAKLDWGAFLRAYADADARISQHAWLADWKAAAPGRSLQLDLLGEGIGATDSDLAFFVLPLWREAGFGGAPAYKVLGRRGMHGWYTQFYFASDGSRALVTENDPDQQSSHWLDHTPQVHFHPRCRPGSMFSSYLVVEATGKWELREFQACQPQG